MRKTMFWISTIMVSLLVILLLLLQTSFFQNYLAEIFINKINQQTRQHIELANLKIKWFDSIELLGLEVMDYQNNQMFIAEKVAVDYELSQLLSEGDLHFDHLGVENGRLTLVKYEDSLGINLLELIRDLNSLSRKKDDSLRKSPKLMVSSVSLGDLVVSYDNRYNDSLPKDKFDYSHFKLHVPTAGFEDFYLKGDTIAAHINSLVASDPSSGMQVDQLEADFLLCETALILDDLMLKTPHSTVKDYVAIRFTGFEDLSYVKDSVTFDVYLDETKLAKKDISYFADVPISDFTVYVTSRISGSIPRLSFVDLRLAIGEKTHLFGDVEFMGLPKIDETFIDANVEDGEMHPDDIAPYVGKAIDNIRRVGDIKFSGHFLGFTNDFVANADFQTRVGSVSSDLNLKFPKGWENARYSGKLVLEDFDVGTFIEDTARVRTVNLTGQIDGRGLTVANAKFYLNAEFHNSIFFGYPYQEIRAKGEFASEFFKGEIAVNDPNSMVRTSGTVNLKSLPEEINVDADIDYLNLQKLGVTRENLEVASKVKADVSGLNIDSLQGQVTLLDLKVNWKNDSISLDSVRLSSFKNLELRDINVAMPELEFELQGDFDFSQVAKDYRVIASEFVSYFEPDFDKRLETVQSHEIFERYTIDFALKYDNINKYLPLLEKNIYISPGGVVEGTYYQRSDATLSLYAEVDSINYKGIGYNKNVFDLNFSKDLDSLGIIASVYLMSEKQIWRHIKPTENLNVEAVWFNNRIDLSVDIDQPANDSRAEINAEMKLARERLLFSFLPSTVIAFGEQWFFNPYNKVEVTENRVTADRVEIYQNAQSIMLKGTYSENMETDLTLKFASFNLSTLNTLLPVNLEGILNSEVELYKDEQSDIYKLAGDINVGDFHLNDFPVGDITGRSRWDDQRRGLFLDVDVERDSINTIAMEGYYLPDDTTNQLDVEAEFNEANLVLLSPILVGLASDISGNASGNIEVTGTLAYPLLNGQAEVSEGSFKLDLLGTVYTFGGDVDFDNRSINFNGIRLRDRDGDVASLNGALRHYGFKQLEADIRIAASNFMFLNTTASDNSLYYGTANATGDIIIRGPVEDLYIKAEATTNRGTKIYIPLSGNQDISQKSYISFVDFSDTTSHVDLNEIVKQNISGVTLDFEIDITSDAYIEMIFDIRTGDIIRGRGEGSLHLTMDTHGEFELFGDVSITEGAYNFTIPNLINKEFSIVPGSTISWYGDPLVGILNLEATYRQMASLADFQGVDVQGTSSQRYPILVVLDLTGEMLSPNIDFEIKYDESQGTLPTSEQLLLNTINNDEQELRRQVFSLLILRKFTQQNQLSMGGAAPVQGSLSEFLSNQFSYYISQVDENLEVDFDLASLSEDAFNTFQLRLSYTFFDGRLRVSGGGAFPQNSADGTTTNGDFIGNWSVRYLLTPDGHLRVKAFSQNEQFAGAWQRESGVSFQYLKSFDDLQELLTKTREEAIRSKPKDVSKEKAVNDEPPQSGEEGI